MGNKQQAEATGQQEISDPAAVTETRWHDTHSQGAALGKLFREERQGWRGGGLQRYVSVRGARHRLKADVCINVFTIQTQH